MEQTHTPPKKNSRSLKYFSIRKSIDRVWLNILLFLWCRNYVIQYIIELKIPSVSVKLISQFKGNYVPLSMQKFSSHVVEKCLKHFEETRPRIIRELLSVSHFEQLLQDPYANYVIQSALAVTKVWYLRFSLKISFAHWSYWILFNAGESLSQLQGPLHASLVEAVRAHMILRTSPYCKRIFTRKLLKKWCVLAYRKTVLVLSRYQDVH